MGRAFEYRKARKLKRWGNMSRTFTRIGKEITIGTSGTTFSPNRICTRAEIVTFLKGRTAEHDDILCQMARATISMVTESVDAYVKHDTIKAEAVLAADDTVDAYFRQVKQALISRIAADPGDGEYALDLLMIAKYFERIGDHATNIAEWVIFSITGQHKEG